jgi:hypothetical protein
MVVSYSKYTDPYTISLFRTGKKEKYKYVIVLVRILLSPVSFLTLKVRFILGHVSRNEKRVSTPVINVFKNNLTVKSSLYWLLPLRVWRF